MRQYHEASIRQVFIYKTELQEIVSLQFYYWSQSMLHCLFSKCCFEKSFEAHWEFLSDLLILIRYTISSHIFKSSIRIIFRDYRRKIVTTLMILSKKSYCEREASKEFWVFNWAQKSRQAVWFWKASSIILLLKFMCWWLLKLLWLWMHMITCSQKNVIKC